MIYLIYSIQGVSAVSNTYHIMATSIQGGLEIPIIVLQKKVVLHKSNTNQYYAFQWRKDLPYDIVSGFTVAVMHIPQVEKHTFSKRIYTSKGKKNCDAYPTGR